MPPEGEAVAEAAQAVVQDDPGMLRLRTYIAHMVMTMEIIRGHPPEPMTEWQKKNLDLAIRIALKVFCQMGFKHVLQDRVRPDFTPEQRALKNLVEDLWELVRRQRPLHHIVEEEIAEWDPEAVKAKVREISTHLGMQQEDEQN